MHPTFGYFSAVLAIACGLAAASARAQDQPKAPAARPDNWGNFLFVVGYAEEEPYHALADPVRYPETLQVLSRMGVDAVKVTGICADPRSRSRNYGDGPHPWRSFFHRVWREQGGKSVVPSNALYCNGNDCQVRLRQGELNYTYADPIVRKHTSASIQAMADLFPDAILRIGGRPVVDWEREHGYSYDPMGGVQDPPTLQAFRDWLRDYYRDPSPAVDGNGDGRTFTADCGTDYKDWETVLPLPPARPGSADAPSLRDQLKQPMLWWLWSQFKLHHFAQWEREHMKATRSVRFIPMSRYAGGVAIHPDQPIVNIWREGFDVDYWTRRDPSKIPVASVEAGWVPFIDDPWMWDRLFATAWGTTSRLRGISYLWFDPGCWTTMPHWGDMNFFAIAQKYEPVVLESQSWWSHTLEAQHWLFGDALTPEPEVAVYENHTFGPWPTVALGSALFEGGYNYHQLGDREIVEGALNHYRVLFIGARRVPLEVLVKIRAFADAGGYVCAIGPSLRWDMAAPRPDLFAAIMGLEPGPGVRAADCRKEEDLEPEDPQAVNLRASPANGEFLVSHQHRCLPYREGTRLPRTWMYPRIYTVEGGEVLARYQNKACVALGRGGRTLCLGGEMTASNFDGAPILGFVQYAGVKPFLTATIDGKRDTANRHGVGDNALLHKSSRENSALRARMFVLTSDIRDVDALLTFPVDGPGLAAWEVRTRTLVSANCTGSVRLNIPKGRTRLLLVAPREVVDRFRKIQERVDRDCRLFDFHCSRHFFFKKPMKASGDAVVPFYTSTPSTPNCIFVLGEKATPADRAFAERLQKTVADWPVASNRIVIPINSAADLTEADYRTNLLLLGGPDENSATRRFCDRKLLSVPGPGPQVLSYHESPWYAGGNVVLLSGDMREPAFEKFWAWLRVWFDSPGHHEPGPYEGWPKARGTLTVKEQEAHALKGGAYRVRFLIQADPKTDLRPWPALTTLSHNGKPASFPRKVEPVLRHPLGAEDPAVGRVGDLEVTMQWKNFTQDPTPLPPAAWARGNVLAYMEHLGANEELLVIVELSGPADKLKGEHRLGFLFDGIPVEARVKLE